MDIRTVNYRGKDYRLYSDTTFDGTEVTVGPVSLIEALGLDNDSDAQDIHNSIDMYLALLDIDDIDECAIEDELREGVINDVEIRHGLQFTLEKLDQDRIQEAANRMDDYSELEDVDPELYEDIKEGMEEFGDINYVGWDWWADSMTVDELFWKLVEMCGNHRENDE